MTRADFLYKHRDVTVYSTDREEVEASTTESKLLVNYISSERNAGGKRIELVELDDHIRGILGSDIERVK